MLGWIALVLVVVLVLIVLYSLFKTEEQSIVTRGNGRLRNLGSCCLKKFGMG